MDFTTEKLSDNLEEMKKITQLHYEESAPYDDIPLDIDWDAFVKLEEFNIVKFFVVRKLNKFIGYAVFFVSPSMEYKSSLQAHMSNLYLHKDHRGSGGKFITWCDDQLRDLGVQVVYHHVKARNDYGVLLNRLGYVRMNLEYAKRLDKE